jgi:hypothetical protein
MFIGPGNPPMYKRRTHRARESQTEERAKRRTNRASRAKCQQRATRRKAHLQEVTRRKAYLQAEEYFFNTAEADDLVSLWENLCKIHPEAIENYVQTLKVSSQELEFLVSGYEETITKQEVAIGELETINDSEYPGSERSRQKKDRTERRTQDRASRDKRRTEISLLTTYELAEIQGLQAYIQELEFLVSGYKETITRQEVAIGELETNFTKDAIFENPIMTRSGYREEAESSSAFVKFLVSGGEGDPFGYPLDPDPFDSDSQDFADYYFK